MSQRLGLFRQIFHRSVWAVGACIVLGGSALACDVPPALVADVVNKSDMKYIGSTQLGAIALTHKAVGELQIECDPNGLSVHTMQDTAFPSKEYFEVTATAAGVVTGAPKKAVLEAMHTCHKRALKDKYEAGTFDSKQLHLECQAFVRDGGGTAIGIWKHGDGDELDNKDTKQ